MDNLSLADIRAATEDNDGMFGGGGMWIFALLILLLIGGGGFFGTNRGGSNAITNAELCQSTQFNNLDSTVRSIENQQFMMANETTKGISDLGYTLAQNENATQSLVAQIANATQAQIVQCCCSNQLLSKDIMAQADQQTCAITTAIHAEGEQTRALLQTNQIQALRDQLSALQLDSRLAGVVRYPSSITYNGGVSPFCGGYSCGCNSGCGCA